MELGVNFSILYDVRVAHSGYYLSEDNQKLLPNHRNTRYITKEFTFVILNDFLSMERLDFCNEWGALVEEGEDATEFINLKKKFASVEKSRSEGEYPSFNTNFDCSWTYNKDGNLCPAFIPKNLSEALTITWHLSIQYSELTKECLHYREFGMRKGCKKIFKAKSNKRFCSNACGSVYATKMGNLARNEIESNSNKALQKIHDKLMEDKK